MSESRQGVYRLSIEKDVELNEFALSESCRMVVEGSVSSADALQLIVEVDDDFAERHEELYLHAVAGDEVLLDEFCSLAET